MEELKDPLNAILFLMAQANNAVNYNKTDVIMIDAEKYREAIKNIALRFLQIRSDY